MDNPIIKMYVKQFDRGVLSWKETALNLRQIGCDDSEINSLIGAEVDPVGECNVHGGHAASDCPDRRVS